MDKVKTLTKSLKAGHEIAFDSLDKMVEALGNIEIKEIGDSILPTGYGLEQNQDAYIERIIIYSEKKEIKGEPWKPTLDTDLIDFMAAAQPPYRVKRAINSAYDYKKTIRDMIAMPQGWFKERGYGGKDWKMLQSTLRKYGFKLYKKGNVIKD